jgi:ribosomal protein S18 acetylase RimI-like enzyme
LDLFPRALQVGGFVADSEPTAIALLDSIFAAPASGATDRVTFFAFTDAPGLVAALRARGLTVDRYWYLRRNIIGAGGTPGSDMCAWSNQQIDATASLLRRAFEPQDAARPFAPDGTEQEWQHYVTQLFTGTGCGSLLPAACYGIGAGIGRLAAIALVTRIAPMTAHLAQLAVDPQMRGRHIGSALLEAACGAAARAGCTRMTLLVGGRNQAARALYQQARFEPAGTFIAAGGSYPRRSTSVAPGGAIMTRR